MVRIGTHSFWIVDGRETGKIAGKLGWRGNTRQLSQTTALVQTFVVEEEEQFVMPVVEARQKNRSADGGAVLLQVVKRQSAAGAIREPRIRIQLIRAIEQVGTAVKLIG